MTWNLASHGWQRRATEPIHGLLVEGTIRPRLSPTEQALFRSQGGPVGGCPLHVLPYLPSFQDGFLLLRRPCLLLSPPRASAGVAVHLTPVATTVQLASRQRCWVVEATFWKVPPLGYVGSRCSRLHQCVGEGSRLVAPPTRGCSTVGGRRSGRQMVYRGGSFPRSTRAGEVSSGTSTLRASAKLA